MPERVRSPGRIALARRGWGRPGGHPVVLLHGIGSDSGTWQALTGWPSEWELVGLDLRGHGQSPWADRYELSESVGDVAAALDELRLGRFDLVGHSMGGMVAYLLAEQRPADLRRLVLVEAPPPLPALPRRDEGPRPRGEWDYDWEFQPVFSGQRNRPPAEWWENLDRIDVPTLILAGRHGNFRHQDLEAMNERIPDSRIRFLDTGHQVHEDDPETFLAEVAGFLGSR